MLHGNPTIEVTCREERWRGLRFWQCAHTKAMLSFHKCRFRLEPGRSERLRDTPTVASKH